MTKKDYELIASVLLDNMTLNPLEFPESFRKWNSIVNNMSIVLASKNPRFDSKKFLQACGVEVEHICAYCNKQGSHFHSIDSILNGKLRK